MRSIKKGLRSASTETCDNFDEAARSGQRQLFRAAHVLRIDDRNRAVALVLRVFVQEDMPEAFRAFMRRAGSAQASSPGDCQTLIRV